MHHLIDTQGLRQNNAPHRKESHVGDQRTSAMATPAALALRSYRERLSQMLTWAENANPSEAGALRLAVARLVEELSRDLLHLYRKLEARELTGTDQTVVMPALERLRDVLRHWRMRARPLRDTLHKAIAAFPTCPS